MRKPHRVVLAAAWWVALATLPAAAVAQNFTRVTDPTNPIITDHLLSGGGSWVDLVGDGYLDLFVANGNLTIQNNRLYRNLRPGGFASVVTGSIVNDGGSSIGATIGDFDNDGRPDVFVTNRNNVGNFLYRGLGDTLFDKVTVGSPVTDIANSNSSSWVDLDNDGDLDLYVVNFQGNDFLYVNGGAPGFAFTRVDTTGLTAGTEFSIPGAWADYNNDGLEDLTIGNAGTQNDFVGINHGGLFFTRAIIGDGLSTLGLSWGDFDNDGYLDLLVVHYQGQVCGLYHNSGPPAFTLSPVGGPVQATGGNWVGSGFGDYDNDGSLDLLIASDGNTSALFHNDGPPGYGFTRTTASPIATDIGSAFGAVWGDYDRDGQLDLFITDRNGAGNRLYHNEGTPNHWLTVRCVGTVDNRSGIGARVRLYATIAGAPRWQLREVTSQTGYNSGNLDQHFGLGDAVVADSLVVDWPSGHRDTWAQVAVDGLLTLTEGTGTVAVETARPGPDALELDAPQPNPGHGEAIARFALPRADRALLELFDVRGRRVAIAVDAWLAAGSHEARLALPAGVPAGVYFCRLTSGRATATVRMAVVSR